MQLQVTTDSVGTARIVRAVGELDLHTASTLDDALTALLDEGAQLLVVDLTEVEFMDSTGLSVILGAVVRLRDGSGELRVVSSRDRITKVFTLTGVDQQIQIFSELDEAVIG